MIKKNWGDMTLAQALDETAERIPHREAIIFEGRRITFRELANTAERLAKALLKAGLKKGDKVAILMTNCPEWVFTRDAVIRAGGWWVPINTRFKSAELKYILGHSDSSFLFINDKAAGIDFVKLLYGIYPEIRRGVPGELELSEAPLLRNIVCLSEMKCPGMTCFSDFLASGDDYPPEELAKATDSVTPYNVVEIAYTSGTTGLPKGVLTTHSQFLKAMAAMAERLGTTDQDRILLPAPMFTNMGNLVGIIQAEMYGAPMVVLELFDPPQILKAIREERCSIFTGSPAMYNMIMDHPNFRSEDVRSMRAGIIGGAPVTPEIVRKVWEKIGMKLFVGYGMTENSAVTTLSEVDDTPELISETCGRLLFPDCEMKIVDTETGRDCPPGVVGEIRTKGWLVTPGYYKMPEETAKSKDEDGWFRTGDLGTLDEKGYLRVTGRLKDMIISGGLNVDPVEIENLLLQHPAVAAAQVVGVPDPRMGEVVMAFVIWKKDMAATDEDITDFCAARIANYKVPKYVKCVEEFPVTAYGKVQKFKLRKKATEELGLGK